MNKKQASWVTANVFCLLLGITVGSSGISSTVARFARQATPQTAACNPQEHSLDATLYMQTSAEYAAVCLQTYSWSLERLKQKLAASKSADLKPAIVMDLDETVLDNSAYQSFLYREKANNTEQSWEVWEKNYADEVRLVPGAKPFVDAAEQMGVTVVYISNRTAKNQAGTVAALKHVGLNTENLGERLLLRENTSDKSARRKIIEGRYNVLMYFGDNLRDFSEEFVTPSPFPTIESGQQQAIAERLAKVQRTAYRWGNDWIVLPNPVYGEWPRLLGSSPAGKLRQTAMKMVQ